MENKNSLVKKRKTQIIRTIIQGISTFVLSYGAFVLGENSAVLVPVFQCVYIDSKTANGICKMLTKSSTSFTNMDLRVTFFFILMIISILILGKLWCGYVCPFGFFQDILTIIRQKFKIHPIIIPSKYKPLVKLIKWGLLVCLLFGIGFCKLCPVKYIMLPLAGSFPGFNLMGIIIAGVVVGISFMKESAFCEVCPLGTVLGLFNKVSGVRIKKKGSACTHCRACYEVCPMEIESIYQLRNKEDVSHPDCIYCMRCLDACPEKSALTVTIVGKPLIVSERSIVKNGKKNKR